jgi:predicted aconitase
LIPNLNPWVKATKRQKDVKSLGAAMGCAVCEKRAIKKGFHKKNRLKRGGFFIIESEMVFCSDPKIGTANTGKHRGVQCVPTFCV